MPLGLAERQADLLDELTLGTGRVGSSPGRQTRGLVDEDMCSRARVVGQSLARTHRVRGEPSDGLSTYRQDDPPRRTGGGPFREHPTSNQPGAGEVEMDLQASLPGRQALYHERGPIPSSLGSARP